MLVLFAEAAALTTVEFQRFNDEVLDGKAQEDGIEVLDPSPELVALTERFILEDLANFDQMAKDNYGIQDAPERIDRFRNLIVRWRDLLATIDANDVEAVTILYKTEIWDKVDAASHGM